MTLDQLKAQREVLLAARFNGVLTVWAGDKWLTYKSDAELQSALADLEREIAKAEGRPRAPGIHPQQRLCRQCGRVLGEQCRGHRHQAFLGHCRCRAQNAERVRTRYVKGFAQRFWCKPDGRRNEALDCRVYAYAALHGLLSMGLNLNKRVEALPPIPASGQSKSAAVFDAVTDSGNGRR